MLRVYYTEYITTIKKQMVKMLIKRCSKILVIRDANPNQNEIQLHTQKTVTVFKKWKIANVKMWRNWNPYTC